MIERCAPTLLDTFQILVSVCVISCSLMFPFRAVNLEEVLRTASHEKQRSGRGRNGSEERIALVAAGAGQSDGASRAGGRDCWEGDRNYPLKFFCQIHRDNSNHDTSDCIALRKEFVMLYPSS